MPDPFKNMLLQAENSFESTIANDTLSQLRNDYGNTVYGPCRSLTANRYPFARGAQAEIGLQQFGSLFGGNGYYDRFFDKVKTYADTSQRDWKWRQDNPVAKQMSPESIRQFQNAAKIKEAFFPTNGNTPMITLTVTPPILAGTGQKAQLDIGGIA